MDSVSFNVQHALDELRHEVHAIGKHLSNKLDDQAELYIDLNNRITVIEERQAIIGKGTWALITTGLGSGGLISWLYYMFHK